MTWMILPMVVMMLLHIMVFGRVLGRLSPPSIFLYMQFIMAIGMVPALEVQNSADKAHGWLVLGTFSVFWVTTVVLSIADDSRLKHELRTKDVGVWTRPRGLVVALFLISVVVCAAYYASIGYNVLGIAVFNALGGGGSDDIATLRFESYAGEKYLFPGYVNQFKNALLPGLICVIVPYLFVKRVSGRLLLSSTLVLISLLFILGTGQRGAFVTFMITVVVFMALMNRRRLPRRMIWVSLISLPVFLVSTFALGRSSSELERASGFLDQLLVIGGEVLYRILGSNQLAALTGFRYVYSQPVVNGHEWWQSFVGLVPGLPGSTLSNEIFGQLYGSMRGTAPPSVWGSAYHNLGLVGTLVLSFLLALIYYAVGRSIRMTSSPNSVQAIGMAGVTTVLGTWVAGSPYYFLNVGLVVFIFLWRWGSRLSTFPSADEGHALPGRTQRRWTDQRNAHITQR